MTQATALIALPRDAYYQVILTLRDLLPPITGSPADIARRDHAAIAQVASLCPANAAQAALAAQYVAANAQAMECLRVTRDPATTPEVAMRCTAQAASMMRQSQGAFRLLLRAQGVKPGRAAEDTDGAAWTEHCAEQWMMDALAVGSGDRGAYGTRGKSENPDLSRGVRDHERDTDSTGLVGDGRDGGRRAESERRSVEPAVMAADTAPQPGGSPECGRCAEGPAVEPPPVVATGWETSQNPERVPVNRVCETNSRIAPALVRAASEHAGHQDAGDVSSQYNSRNTGHCPMPGIHEMHMGGPDPSEPQAMII